MGLTKGKLEILFLGAALEERKVRDGDQQEDGPEERPQSQSQETDAQCGTGVPHIVDQGMRSKMEARMG